MERTHILVGIAVAGAGVTAAWRVCGGLATAVEVSAVKPVTIGAKEAAARRPVLMLFGDSITQFSFNPELCGWGAALAHWYARQADVLNRGFSGYNTRQGRILLQKLLPLPETGVSTQPRLLTIMFGANDAADEVHNVRQHVPVSEYESNLRDMIAHARAACPGILIVLITPPPLDEKAYAAHNLALKRRKASDPIDRSIGRVRPYVEAVARVADSLGCPMVNLWDGPDPVGSNADDFCDGLHLGPGGNRKVFQRLQARMRECLQGDDVRMKCLLPDDGPDGSPHMPMQYPYWMQASACALDQWDWPRN